MKFPPAMKDVGLTVLRTTDQAIPSPSHTPTCTCAHTGSHQFISADAHLPQAASQPADASGLTLVNTYSRWGQLAPLLSRKGDGGGGGRKRTWRQWTEVVLGPSHPTFFLSPCCWGGHRPPGPVTLSQVKIPGDAASSHPQRPWESYVRPGLASGGDFSKFYLLIPFPLDPPTHSRT